MGTHELLLPLLSPYIQMFSFTNSCSKTVSQEQTLSNLQYIIIVKSLLKFLNVILNNIFLFYN
jgi:hypothetical protein